MLIRSELSAANSPKRVTCSGWHDTIYSMTPLKV